MADEPKTHRALHVEIDQTNNTFTFFDQPNGPHHVGALLAGDSGRDPAAYTSILNQMGSGPHHTGAVQSPVLLPSALPINVSKVYLHKNAKGNLCITLGE